MPKPRILRKTLSAVAVLIPGLVVCLLAGLHLAPVQNRVFRFLASRVHDSTGIMVEAARFRYNLFLGSAELHDLKVLSDSPRGRGPFVEVPSVRIRFRPLRIVKGLEALESIHLESPVVRLVLDPDRKRDAPGRPSSRPFDWSMLPGRVAIENGTIRIQDASGARELHISGLRLQVKEEDGGRRLSLENLEPGSLQSGRVRMPLQEVRCVGRIAHSDLEIREFTLRAGDNRLTGRGWIRNLSDPVTDLSLASQLDLAELSGLVNRAVAVGGSMTTTARIEGPAERISAEIEAGFSDLRVAEMDAFSGAAALVYERASSLLTLRKFQARSAFGGLSASGSVSFSARGHEGELRANLEGVNPAAAMTGLGWNIPLATQVSGPAAFSWEGSDWSATRGRAELTLAPKGAAGQDSFPLGGSVGLAWDAKGLELRAPDISGPGVNMTAELRTDRSLETLEGSLKGEAGEVATLMEAARSAWPQAMSRIRIPLGGSLRWSAELAGSRHDPRIDAAVEAADLRAGAVEGLKLDGTASYRGGRLQVPDLELSWRNQYARVTGSLDLISGGSPRFDLRAELENASIAELLAGFGFDSQIDGRIGARVAGNGSLSRPEFTVSLHGDALSVYGESFGSLAAAARVSGSRLTVDSLRLEKPQQGETGILEGSGTLDWGKDVVQLQVRSNALRIESMVLPDQSPVRGVLSLEASARGALSVPDWSVRLSAQELLAAGRSLGDIAGSVQGRGTAGEVDLELPQYAAALRGEVGLASPYPARLALDSAGMDLAGFHGALPGGVSVDGSLALHAEAEGPMARPQDSTVRISLRNLDAGVGEYRIRSRSDIEAEWENRALVLHPVVLEFQEGELRLEGRIPLDESDRAGELTIEGSFPLFLLPHFVPSAKNMEIAGTADIQGALRGSLRKIQPSLEVVCRDGELGMPGMSTPLTDIALEAGADSAAVEVRRLEARLENGTIRAQAVLPLEALSGEGAASSMRAEIELSGINPAAVADRLQALTGVVDAQVLVQAPSADLRTLQGSVVFSELDLKGETSEIVQSGQTRLKIEKGRIEIEHLVLKGPADASLEAAGWIDLLEEQALDLRISGVLDAELLSAGIRGFDLAGLVEIELAAAGTLKAPRLNGTADLKDGRLSTAAPPLAAEALAARLEFADDRITLTRLDGRLNGGSLEAEGSASIAGGDLSDLQIKAVAGDIFLDYPKGLRTVSNLELAIRSRGELFLVEGAGRIVEGVYREPLDLKSLQQGPASGAGWKPTALDRIRFDVRLETDAPIVVDNNLARLDAYVDLRLAGSARRPALLGRLELEEGGRVYVSERMFTIDRAVVDFTSEQRIEPALDLRAQTRVGEYTITFNAIGGLTDMEATFTADPAATEDQIQSLLLTGSPDNTDRIASGSLAYRSALSLFGSTVTGGFSRRMRALGFSEFRIEPSLISADSDPTARLTMGVNLSPELSLTYSWNLRNSNDQIWIAEYDWHRNFLARYLNRSEDTDRGDVRHRVRFGGGPETGDIRTAARPRVERLESLEIAGNMIFPEEVIRKRLKLKPGSKFDFIEAQGRLERLRRFYGQEGYLEAVIRQERVKEGNRIRWKLDVEAARPLAFRFEGVDVPKSLRREVERAWQAGMADGERLRSTSALLRLHFFRTRYCDAEISATIDTEPAGEKIVTYRLSPGFRYDRVLVRFPDLDRKLAKDLIEIVRDNNLELEMQSDPASVGETLEMHLRERGYLTAEISLPRVERNKEDGTYASVIGVQPGPRYRLGEVHFEGNREIGAEDLQKALEMSPGDPYTPERLGSLLESLGAVYWRVGYREAEAEADVELHRDSGTVDLLFRIRENRRATVADIEIAGNVKTSDDFLQRRIPFETGDAVDGDKLDLMRRKLVSAGSYNMVDITLPPSEQPEPQPEIQPLDLSVRVREPKPFSFEYGLTYDGERKAGLVFDAGTRNVLGEGRLLGYRIIADREEVDQRIYFSQPFLGRVDISTNVEAIQENSVIEDLSILKRSFTIQQLIEFRRRFTFSYGYRFQRMESRPRDSGSLLLESSDTTSPLLAALTRDTRDDVFDATRGSYVSQAFEYGPTFLGGNLPYYRYFGQYFRYFGLGSPGAVPFAVRRRPRFVFASGVRLGLMDTLENRDFTPGDRFFGGGATSIRGFKQNSLGPKLSDGQPVGGQAVLFLNNELRTPLYKWLGAAVFLDIGNVFEKPSDFRFSDLRKSAGIGLRFRNPLVMIRFDYGWKLDRRTGESGGAFHFGIGQAF